MKYLGVNKALNRSRAIRTDNPFNRKSLPYKSLGAQIIEAVKYGSEIGAPAVVQYDEADSEAVDVLTSPDHDFFDIAEQFGQEVATPAPLKTETTE